MSHELTLETRKMTNGYKVMHLYRRRDALKYYL